MIRGWRVRHILFMELNALLRENELPYRKVGDALQKLKQNLTTKKGWGFRGASADTDKVSPRRLARSLRA